MTLAYFLEKKKKFSKKEKRKKKKERKMTLANTIYTLRYEK